jgi:uncharacterized SAM-binding protein YcdF (DUF218 family)
LFEALDHRLHLAPVRAFHASLKSIIAFIEPLGLAWLGITALLVCMIWRRNARHALLLGVPWLLLTLVLCTPVPSHLLASMERPWADFDPTTLPAADAIVSLGGAGESSAHEITGFHFTRGTDRVMTAVELVRRGKADLLVLGGGGHRGPAAIASEADAVKQWVESWNVLETPVLSLGVCLDTHDEAVKTAVLAKERGWGSIILVTSASHMGRAEATFRKAGLNVTCAPCNYLSSVIRRKSLSWFHAPHHAGAELFGIWFHEVLGWAFYRWQGWV